MSHTETFLCLSDGRCKVFIMLSDVSRKLNFFLTFSSNCFQYSQFGDRTLHHEFNGSGICRPGYYYFGSCT